MQKHTMFCSNNKNQVQCQMYQTFTATKAMQLANWGRPRNWTQ